MLRIQKPALVAEMLSHLNRMLMLLAGMELPTCGAQFAPGDCVGNETPPIGVAADLRS